MRNKGATQKGFLKRLKRFLNTYTSLLVIIAAALLLELTTGVLYYAAQNNLQKTMERLVQTEMNAIYLCIRNKLVNVEVTLDNMAWVVKRDLGNPDWMFETPLLLVQNNQSITGGGICFIPNYYPAKGRLFEPVAIREDDGDIVTKQVGSDDHDYTEKELYTIAVTTGKSHWSEPYYDEDGSKKMVTTYSVPVRDQNDKTVAVVFADISVDWLDEVMDEAKVYKSTQRFLITGSHNHLAGEDSPAFRKALSMMAIHDANDDDNANDDDDGDGYFTMDDNGKKLHVFYTPVGGSTDWVLIHAMEDSEVFGSLRHTRLILLLPLMIGLLFVGFIVWRSSRNLERLHKTDAERQRISGELHVASQIQQSMLPNGHIHQDDVDICGMLKPVREVGGDLYDYFIRDEKLFFCIGDVSGKGAPSAMLMSVCHALFRSASAHESNPSRIMHAINEATCQGNESCMFVTMFIGVLDLPTGRLRYCDAGHDAPIVIGHGSVTDDSCTMAVTPHLPIGVFEDTRYIAQEVVLKPDSTLFLYTDGLTEAKNKDRRLFGLERVINVLNTCSEKAPEEILTIMTDAVDSFVLDAEQSDDLTMMVIRYTPRQFESTVTETLVIKNDVKEVTRFSSFMKEAAEKLDIEKSLARQVRLAVEEAVVNVIDYAYPPGTEGDITVKLMSDGHTLHFQIIDNGVPFDPTEKEKADTTLSAEDRQIGGLGILLVRELMDSINYERADGKNILTLIKNIKQ